jgi:hypothetical protein
MVDLRKAKVVIYFGTIMSGGGVLRPSTEGH